MAKNLESKGTFWQRLQSISLTLILALLLIWFLGFLRYDVGDLEGPDRQSYIGALDQGPQEQLDDLIAQQREIRRELQRNRSLQQGYKDSKENARQVMEEITALHRLSLDQKIQPHVENVLALADARSRFLSSQEKLETANIAVRESNSRDFELTDDIFKQREVVRKHNIPATEQFSAAYDSHRLGQEVQEKPLSANILCTPCRNLLGGRGHCFRAFPQGVLQVHRHRCRHPDCWNVPEVHPEKSLDSAQRSIASSISRIV